MNRMVGPNLPTAWRRVSAHTGEDMVARAGTEPATRGFSAAGTVALADVTARLLKPTTPATEVVLTGITTPAANTFEVEWTSADTDPAGFYKIRWESNTPSPKIVVEDVTTTFRLAASV